MSKRAPDAENEPQDAAPPMTMVPPPPPVAAVTTVTPGADPVVATTPSFTASAVAAALPPSSSSSAGANGPPRKRLKKGNIFLTNEQRQALCIKAATSKVTQAQLCFWAKDEFGLTGPLNQSTISRILAEKDKYIAIEGNSLAQKRKTYVEHPQLEAALSHWLLVSSHNNQRLQGDVIKEKGRAFAQLLGIESKISFSNGWLTGFKKRHQTILSTAASSEAVAASSAADVGAAATATSNASIVAASASVDVVADLGSWGLQQVLQDYNPRDIFNVDETGLFYAMPPEKTLRKGGGGGGAGSKSAPKPTKEKLTLLLAVNADGSERLDPLFIGKSRHPAHEPFSAVVTTFGKKKQLLQQQQDAMNGAANEQLNFNYSYSERTWLNAIVFQKWLNTLNSQMKIENRHILLLVDNAPSHITRGLKLTNVRVLKLPSASDSVAFAAAQPLEMGIVTAFKRRYRKRQMVHALDRYEAGDSDIYSVDEVQAMKWCRAAWSDVPKSLVAKCWLDSKLFGETLLTKDDVHVDETESDIDLLIKEISYKLPLKRVMTLKEILSPADEGDNLHFVGATDADFLTLCDELSATQSGISSSSSTNEPVISRDATVSLPASTASSAVSTPRDGVMTTAPSSSPISASGSQAPAAATTGEVNQSRAVASASASQPPVETANGSASRPQSTSVSAARATSDQQPQQKEDAPISYEELLSYVQKIVPNLERLGCDERTIQSMRDVRQSLKQRVMLAGKTKQGDGSSIVI